MDEKFEIERAHRLLAPMQNADQPPRLVLIHFLRQSARDVVIASAKEKRRFEWERCRLSFFPDMTRELAEKKRNFCEEEAMRIQREIHTGLPGHTAVQVEGEEPELHYSGSSWQIHQ